MQKWCISYSPIQVNTYKYKEDFFCFGWKTNHREAYASYKKKPNIEFLQTHLVKIWATLLPSWFTQLMSKKMNCTVRDWTSSAKLSSLRGIRYLGALIASMQFWESLSTLTLCIFNRLAKIIAQWIVKKTVLNNCRGDDWMIGKMWKIERNNIGSLCNMVNMEGSKWGWIQPNWENSLYKLQIYKSKFTRANKKT